MAEKRARENPDYLTKQIITYIATFFPARESWRGF